MKATVTTHYADASTARSIAAAVDPDNRVAPKPLHIMSRAKGRRVVSTITGAQDIDSLLGTIDDMLLCLIAVDGLASTPKYGRTRARTKH